VWAHDDAGGLLIGPDGIGKQGREEVRGGTWRNLWPVAAAHPDIVNGREGLEFA
jgi:hypothetical protein